MRRFLICGVAVLPFAASTASGGLVYDNMALSNEFVTQYPTIYFDDAVLAGAGPVHINQFNIGYENESSVTTNFDLLIQFYNTVNYGASFNTSVGTSAIGSLVDITGLSAAGGVDDQTGLFSLSGNLPIATSGTVGYEFEFVTPGTTGFDLSKASSVVPIFRSGAPTLGSSSNYFAYDYLMQSTIVGDSSSGDVFTFANPSNVFAQIGGVAGSATEVVPSGQHYTFNPASGPGVTLNSVTGLTINSTALATVIHATATGNRQLLQVSSPGLSIAGSMGNWSGLLDLTNNDLDLPGASLATVTDQIHEGFAQGHWNGSGGITSSSAASSKVNALGIIQNNQGGTALFTTFDGSPVGASDVLVKYTYFGDANLDGKVDGSDYSRIDNGYLSNGSATGWFNGDFNYDGVINGSDYTLIDNAFNTQGASLSAEIAPPVESTAEVASSIVPEPAASLMLALISGSMLSRRRRRSVCDVA